MVFSSIRKSILNKIKPAKKEEEDVKKIAHAVIDAIGELGHEAVVVGSIGKHTWLKGDHDIDIFVLFSEETAREELEKK